MQKNDYVKAGVKRSRIFEASIVLIVISVVLFFGKPYYQAPVEQSQFTLIEIHAGVFSRMMTNLYAMAKTNSDNAVKLNSSTIYFNEFGWPANASAALSPSIRNQTADECQQLWQAAFANPPSSGLSENRYKKNIDYHISLKKNVICRYELVGKQEQSYFIDYDTSKGAVVVERKN